MSLSDHLLIIAGPSGAGKSTLIHTLLDKFKALTVSVSCTTRSPRGAERDGVEYHFLTRAEFERLRDEEDAFVEWAEVHGNLYGTQRKTLEDSVSAGNDLIFDVDVQGTEKLKACFPEAWSVLILPPSFEVLSQRLTARATDPPEVIQRRLDKARWEMSQTQHFDFIITNDLLADSTRALEAVYRAMQSRRGHASQASD